MGPMETWAYEQQQRDHDPRPNHQIASEWVAFGFLFVVHGVYESYPVSLANVGHKR